MGSQLRRGGHCVQKNISIRRDAQKLAKQGQLAKAIAVYKPLLSSNGADPYDHLYVGDLLVKNGQPDEAIVQYESAIHQYSNLGFHRNAIALCRKILRLRSDHIQVYYHLGNLYAAEELIGDALEAYTIFLERSPEDSRNSEEFRDTVKRAVAVAPRSVDFCLRLGDVLNRLGRSEEAAELFGRATLLAHQSGDGDLAADLQARAEQTDPAVAARIMDDAKNSAPEASPARGPTDPQSAEPVIEITAAAATGRLEVSPPPGDSQGAAAGGGDPPGLSELTVEDLETTSMARAVPDTEQAEAAEADDFGDGLDIELGTLPAQTADETVAESSAPREGAHQDLYLEPPEEEDSVEGAEIELRETMPPAEKEVFVIDGASDECEPEAEEAPGAERTDEPADGAPAGGLADPRGAALAAMKAEQWTSALKRADEWIQLDPLSMEAVEKLIEISEALQDNAQIVRGLILQGDLHIREGEIKAAVPVFRRVLEIEPGNSTAERRMARFAELGLTDGREETETPEDAASETPEDVSTVKQVLGAKAAVVSVQDPGDGAGEDLEQQDWLEISALLDEFREGIKQQVREHDLQTHYDLGVSHMEMGLVDEALEEFDAALACSDATPRQKLQLNELRGRCFSRVQRHREAIHAFRSALETEDCNPEEKAGLQVQLAGEHQAVGEADEAIDCLREVLQFKPDHEEAGRLLLSLEKDAA